MLARTQRCLTRKAFAVIGALLCYAGEGAAFQSLAGLRHGMHAMRHSGSGLFRPGALGKRRVTLPSKTIRDEGGPSCLKMQGSEPQVELGKPVLVVGEDLGIRQQIVKKLLDRGASVRVMANDQDSSAVRSLQELEGAMDRLNIVQGDVCKLEELVQGMNDCRACISFDTARRPSQLKDILFKMWDPTSEFLGAWGPSKPDVLPEEWGDDYSWLDPGTDPKHPWNTKFLAQCNLLDAAERTDCQHILRISDTRIAGGPWSPSNIMDNILQSMEVKWAHEGELVLHDVADELGAAFTLIRPADLIDGPRPADQHLLLSTDGAVEGSMSTDDLAALCVESVLAGSCANATVACGWGRGADGAQEWAPLAGAVQAWDGVVRGREMHATAVASSTLGPVAALLAYGFYSGQLILEGNFRFVMEAMPILGLGVTIGSAIISERQRQNKADDADVSA